MEKGLGHTPVAAPQRVVYFRQRAKSRREETSGKKKCGTLPKAVGTGPFREDGKWDRRGRESKANESPLSMQGQQAERGGPAYR
mgnify:CR=1 FL=1